MFRKILLAGLVAASFASVPLTVSAQQRTIIVREAPPATREETTPRQRRGQEWSPGHWVWRNGEYRWVRGNWVRERRGQHWVGATWVQRDGQWVYQAAHWQRGGRNRDQDGDGIRNRDDRDRDGDGIRNRNDRDRDGDGVRNRNDAAPNNPNRN